MIFSRRLRQVSPRIYDGSRVAASNGVTEIWSTGHRSLGVHTVVEAGELHASIEIVHLAISCGLVLTGPVPAASW